MSYSGLILRCDAEGVVTDILHEGRGLEGTVKRGRPLTAIVDRASFGKALDFLSNLRSHGCAYDWEINVGTPAGIATYRFSGGQDNVGMTIAVVPTDRDLDLMIEEMTRVNSEHVTMLRRLFKEGAARQVAFNSLSSVNNDLITVQRELAKANARLQAANDTKNRLFGILAHDLRSPLGVVSGFAEFLEYRLAGRITEQEQSFITAIRDSSSYMLSLVEDTLSLSTIESGHLSLDRKPVDLALQTARVVGMLTVVAERKGVILTLECPAAPLIAEVDATKFEQVLNNLIGNAIKFSHAGGAIQVAIASAEGKVRLSVSDQGTGIADDAQASLFEPFAAGRRQGTAGENSTGLGLYICQRVIAAHGGTIAVSSAMGRGTTLTVILPALG